MQIYSFKSHFLKIFLLNGRKMDLNQGIDIVNFTKLNEMFIHMCKNTRD